MTDKLKSRFDYKLPSDLQPKDIDRFVVKIPVGGIAPDGTIYEQVIRPDGNEPIYKEVKIDDTEQPTTVTEKETEEETDKSDTPDE